MCLCLNNRLARPNRYTLPHALAIHVKRERKEGKCFDADQRSWDNLTTDNLALDNLALDSLAPDNLAPWTLSCAKLTGAKFSGAKLSAAKLSYNPIQGKVVSYLIQSCTNRPIIDSPLLKEFLH